MLNASENRIINPFSRSPADRWTIIYKDAVVAQDEFSEIQPYLQAAPQQAFSYPYIVAKQIIFYCGLAAIVMLCFLSGFLISNFVNLTQNKPKEPIIDYTQDFSNLQNSIQTIIQRQEIIKSVVTAIPAKLDEPKIEVVPVKEEEPKVTFSELLNMERQDSDIRQLVDWENKKEELLLRDRELNNQGYTPLYRERRSLQAGVTAIEQLINQLKKKHSLMPE